MKSWNCILFTIRDEYEKHNKSGVNCMYFDADHKYLYSGGRDTIIRRWNCFYSGEEMEPEYMEHHIDWVNDLFLCENDSKLISASNDFTVKVWNTDTLSCISTIRNHTDYVTCLSYSAFSNKFVSGSLDKTILIWDLSEYNSAAKSRLECIRSSTKNSIYSIDIFKSGNVIISGDSSNTVRLTDLRDGVSRMELHGHTSTVKCVSHVEDNNLIISGGSDGMLIVWDMRQNKLLSKKYLHERGIWTMLVNKVGQKIYTSGQQGLLYYSEFNKELTSKLLYKTPHDESILNMCIQSDDIMWISKNTSYIDKLEYRKCLVKRFLLIQMEEKNMENEKVDINHCSVNLHEAIQTISQCWSSAPIIDFKVLNDKRNIITKKSNGEVEIYDVLLGKKIKSLGKTDYETEITKRQTIVYKHAWFNAEIKSGMLSIILDEIDCLNCWDVVEDCAFDKG
ncbi:WD repeat-containing protein 48 [Intoshia linei]|uniref:WD repeat-containing protein 48 n=1 Tax=Intoshia linei TaxID=1819745 RepID=A0A177B6M2_9BILA|nr:WD repeat-containing protein 48 [Intoshia linei]